MHWSAAGAGVAAAVAVAAAGVAVAIAAAASVAGPKAVVAVATGTSTQQHRHAFPNCDVAGAVEIVSIDTISRWKETYGEAVPTPATSGMLLL